MKPRTAAAAAVAVLVAAGALLWRAAGRAPAGPDAPAASGSAPAGPATLDPSRPGAQPVGAAAEAAPSEPPPAHQPAAPVVAQRGVVRPAAARAPAPGAAPWDEVETALRPAALGPDLASAVSDGLAEARDGMQYCFDEEAKALARDPSPRSPPPGAAGPAVLVLRLEALHGKLAVAGVEVASPGTSTRRLVECCRAAMVGFEFAAPAARPPERFKVTMPLM